MPDVGTTAGKAAEKADSIFTKIADIANSTHIPQQVGDADLALFTNFWFFYKIAILRKCLINRYFLELD